VLTLTTPIMYSAAFCSTD